jgi:hypothetical protein
LGKIDQAVTALTQAVQNTLHVDTVADRHDPAARADASALHQEIAQILRDELRKLRVAAGDGRDSPHAEILNTQENIEAYTRAHDVVRIALAAKRWTDEDAQELRQSIGYLTRVQQEEIL